MNPATTLNAVAICLQVGHVPLIEGRPGGGKSESVGGVVRALDRNYLTLISALHEPSDFNGWPHAVMFKDGNGMMKFLPIEWVYQCLEDPRMVVFLDEITMTPPSVQGALLRVVHERVVGSIAIPKTVGFVAAANPPEQAAGGWELAEPLSNRMIHLIWKADYKFWRQGMLSGWPTPKVPILPSDWKDAQWDKAMSLVDGYLYRNPEHLDQPPAPGQKAFPTPRTWEKTVDLLAACFSVGMTSEDDTPAALVEGAIGPAVGGNFLQWAWAQDLPDPEKLLENPTGFDYSTLDSGQLAATLGSVSRAVVRNNSVDRWKNAWRVVVAAAKAKEDVAAASVGLLINNAPGPVLPPPEVMSLFSILAAAEAIEGKAA